MSLIPSEIKKRLRRQPAVKQVLDLYHITRRRLQGTYDRTLLFRHVNVETNNICTRKCFFCEFGLPGRVQNTTVMSDQLFEKILSELQALDYRGRLSLFEINEPLTDKRIFRLLQEASDRLPNAYHTLTSNGDLLTPEKLAALFDAGLDRLYLSSYDEKGRARNVALIAGAAKSAAGKIIHQDMTVVPELNLDNRGGMVELEGPRPEFRGRPCERVERQMIIKPTGMVVSCSSDFYGVNALGDLNNQTLREVWFGERFEKLRADLRGGNRGASSLCAKCDYPGYGGFYDDIPVKASAAARA